jgi:uncharacterized protein YegP (UPF0339 family)
MNPYTFHILRSAENGELYWHLRAGNGEIVAASGETYTDLGGCLGGLYGFKLHAAAAPLNDRTPPGSPGRVGDHEFELFRDEAGEHRWRFQAGNNQIIATSGEGYSSKRGAADAVARVRTQASKAEVEVDVDEPVDVESCAKAGHGTPKAKRYRIRIDRQQHVLDRPSVTGRELLATAGKQPHTRFRIDQKLRGGEVRKIGYDESVSLCAPGVERFMTIPLDQTEG